MNQDNDTRPFPTSPAREAGSAQTGDTSRSRRRLVIGVAIGALLILVSVSTTLFLTRPQSDQTDVTPAAAPPSGPASGTTPSAEPSSEPEPSAESSAPPVQAPSDPTVNDRDALAFTGFQPSGAAVVCNDEAEVYPITFSWQSQNAVAAWFGVDTPNAKAAPLQEVTPNGSITWDFFCSNTSTTYTVTLSDANGALVHRSVVVERS